jgi:hypothetical protein
LNAEPEFHHPPDHDAAVIRDRADCGARLPDTRDPAIALATGAISAQDTAPLRNER